MDMDITFCTFYFDIDRQNWDSFNIPNNTYLYWFQNVLSLNINLHIETEEKFVERILSYRRKFDPLLKRTIIKSRKVEELPAYNLYNEKLETVMFSDSFKLKIHHGSVPEMCRPLYNILMFNKLHSMKQVIDENPFNTKFFSWIDVGFIRDEKWVINNENWPDPSKLKLNDNKILFFVINNNIIKDLGNADVKQKEYHCMSQCRYLKGTIFFLDGSIIDELLTSFDKNVRYCLDNNFIGSDEKIFDLCYLDNPEAFDLVQCDWRQEFHLYAAANETEYSLNLSWNPDDIEQVDEYDFLYIGVEDTSTKVIHRCDLNPTAHPDVFARKVCNVAVNFKSSTKPHRYVVWPVDVSKRWLRRLEFPISC